MKLNEMKYKAWFLNYVKNYGNIQEISLKRDHSLRVAKNMKEVFSNWDVDDEYISLAGFIGLYHDIGRFEQWKIYNTFVDGVSIDHASLGTNILFKPEIVGNLLPERIFDLTILNSIYHHNKYSLPLRLNAKDEWVFYRMKNFDVYSDYIDKDGAINSLYAMAIRDADKIDILKLYLLSNNTIDYSEEAISQKVANDFFNNKPILIQDRKNINDSILLRLAFINDINLMSFLKQFKEENIIDQINEICPNKQLLQIYFDHAKKRLDELIKNNKHTQYVLKK